MTSLTLTKGMWSVAIASPLLSWMSIKDGVVLLASMFTSDRMASTCKYLIASGWKMWFKWPSRCVLMQRQIEEIIGNMCWGRWWFNIVVRVRGICLLQGDISITWLKPGTTIDSSFPKINQLVNGYTNNKNNHNQSLKLECTKHKSYQMETDST